MCIVCEIRNKLAIEVRDPEAIGFVMQRVELMARILHNVTELGKQYAETGPGIDKRVFLDTAVIASACLSDSVEATEHRNAEMAAHSGKDEAEALFDLIGALIGLKRRNDAEPEGNPGLPPEVWAAMPAELREMMKGAKVVHIDSESDLFEALTGRKPTKH
ncbi:hypothetical protein Shy_CDS0041 [Escherichia phage Shy]|uniref:Uncharacterized protein n=1 Tax=Escherichia phage Halfdan TaxID=2234092 RepID=A0A2Z5H495_9CAUD|nr:hypothetical protein P7I17_gp39 [Escherichia phage Halfdan]AXC34293.1 hypothetical protein [Escherichia phage Halfdan]WQZ00318.1 hypothetical protein Shy_CDS0041 [Escherichia phage Shy]